MKRLLIILLQLLASLTLFAQTPRQIMAGGDFIWAEGKGGSPSEADAAATTALTEKLAATDILHAEYSVGRAAWSTYTADIRECSLLTYESDGAALRYIAWKDVPKLFSRRWRKVRELAESARVAMRSGKTDIARTYCHWADTYLLTLPPGEDALRADIARMKKDLGNGTVTAVRIRNVESEVRAIRRALSLDVPKVAAVDRTPAPVSPDNNSVAPDRSAISKLPQPEGKLLLSSFIQPKEANLPAVSRKQQNIAPVTAKPQPASFKLLATAEFSSSAAFGGRLIWQPGRFGPYLSARSSFSSKAADYTCRSDGSADFGFIWVSGAARCSRTAFSAGYTCQAFKFLSIYAGAGYADDAVLWEDFSAQWARVEDLSVKGLLTEAGIIVNIGRFNIGGGISLTSFSRPCFILDAGITF